MYFPDTQILFLMIIYNFYITICRRSSIALFTIRVTRLIFNPISFDSPFSAAFRSSSWTSPPNRIRARSRRSRFRSRRISSRARRPSPTTNPPAQPPPAPVRRPDWTVWAVRRAAGPRRAPAPWSKPTYAKIAALGVPPGAAFMCGAQWHSCRWSLYRFHAHITLRHIVCPAGPGDLVCRQRLRTDERRSDSVLRLGCHCRRRPCIARGRRRTDGAGILFQPPRLRRSQRRRRRQNTLSFKSTARNF